MTTHASVAWRAGKSAGLIMRRIRPGCMAEARALLMEQALAAMAALSLDAAPDAPPPPAAPQPAAAPAAAGPSPALARHAPSTRSAPMRMCWASCPDQAGSVTHRMSCCVCALAGPPRLACWSGSAGACSTGASGRWAPARPDQSVTRAVSLALAHTAGVAGQHSQHATQPDDSKIKRLARCRWRGRPKQRSGTGERLRSSTPSARPQASPAMRCARPRRGRWRAC